MKQIGRMRMRITIDQNVMEGISNNLEESQEHLHKAMKLFDELFDSIKVTDIKKEDDE